MFFVYILYSKNFDKTYTGQTKDIENRLLEHNETSLKGFTVSYRPWILIYNEEFATRGEAMKREKYLKTWAGRILIKEIVENYFKNKLS